MWDVAIGLKIQWARSLVSLTPSDVSFLKPHFSLVLVTCFLKDRV